jgi:hypothetical protein
VLNLIIEELEKILDECEWQGLGEKEFAQQIRKAIKILKDQNRGDKEIVKMAHGFIIKCEKCGSENCRIDTVYNGEFIEVDIVCDDCGQIE